MKRTFCDCCRDEITGEDKLAAVGKVSIPDSFPSDDLQLIVSFQVGREYRAAARTAGDPDVCHNCIVDAFEKSNSRGNKRVVFVNSRDPAERIKICVMLLNSFEDDIKRRTTIDKPLDEFLERLRVMLTGD